MSEAFEVTVKNINITPIQVISHIRKNHAMEHATIHILTKSHPNISFAGYSLIRGFWIMGNIELQEVQKAAELAYARLKNGAQHLAVHPNCGTNLAVTGLCTAAASSLALMGEPDDDSGFSRFSALLSAGLVGALISRPLGPKVQKYITTDADMRGLSIVGINSRSLRGQPVYFIETAYN